MKPDEIRSKYLSFFAERDHRVVSSSPVIPQGDQTLLFTNAGMNQFKDVLLGNEKRDYARAASVQKCIRAGGKHNDLDEVGRDGRHLTFFEMLGNWSFGDYYKRDTIKWAWEVVTEVLGLDVERVYITTYKDDDEAYDIWTKEIGIPLSRIARQGDVEQGNEENFWSMGPTGPCGPCTELFFDMSPSDGPVTFIEGQYDEERIIEFWNCVFMEFNRDEDGNLTPLPMQSVDTGMGLDRIAMVKAGARNVFQTELFTPIFVKTAELLGQDISADLQAFYNDDLFTHYAVIADHIRSVTFSLCDGAKFGNQGRGSVLRSILRRAMFHGKQLGFETPFMHEVAQAVIDTYSDVYPELAAVGSQARTLIKLEEEKFLSTLDRGLSLFERVIEKAKETGEGLDGETIFTLHTTFGFPPDMTAVLAEDEGVEVDMDGYQVAFSNHQLASKGKDLYANAIGAGDWATINEGPAAEFTGYTSLTETAQIRRYRTTEAGCDVLLSITPFYAESGGQVGDTGTIVAVNGGLSLEVTDTQKTPIGIVHHCKIVSGELTEDTLSGDFNAQVDATARKLTISNHTATHLLHAALRDLVSDEVFQSGSSVTPEKLRFDFSLGQPVSSEQLRAIEDRVNEQIRQGHVVTIHEGVDRDHAVNELGAMAIFGEKYGDTVRVVDIPGESVELCGGTHVSNTNEIGLFRITHESGVAAGIRRIEAVTGQAAYASFQQDRELLTTVAHALKAESHNVLDRAKSLTQERAELERKLRQMSQKLAQLESAGIVNDAIEIDGVKVIAQKIDVDSRDQLLAYADKLRDKLDQAAILLGAEIDGKAALLCALSDSVFKQRKVKAGDLVNKVASHVNGRGGGRPTLAQAGGSNPAGLQDAVDAFEAAVRETFGA